MTKDFLDYISDFNFIELLDTFLDNGFYEYLFPFLLVFAVLYSVLSNVGIFRSKRTGETIKSVVFIISLAVSYYGVSFKLQGGYSLGELLMMMFPNISALTMLVLVMYVVGAILGKNIFKGVFSKKPSSFLYMTIGGIGLGAILYYVGIAMGFWDFDPFDQNSYWNFIIALFLLILGIVFIVIGLVPVGVLFLCVFGLYLYNSGEGNILEYFIDPIIFIFIIVIFLFSWLNSSGTKKRILRDDLLKEEKTLKEYRDLYGRKPRDYESRIHDIVDSTYESNKKKWKKLTGEDWK